MDDNSGKQLVKAGAGIAGIGCMLVALVPLLLLLVSLGYIFVSLLLGAI